MPFSECSANQVLISISQPSVFRTATFLSVDSEDEGVTAVAPGGSCKVVQALSYAVPDFLIQITSQ